MHLYERIALISVILLFIYMLWYMTFYKPLEKSISIKQSSLKSEQSENKKINQEISKIQSNLLYLSGKQNKLDKNYSQLLQQSNTLTDQLTLIHNHLISYDQMPILLENLIKDKRNLKLVSLDVLPKKLVKNTRLPIIYQHKMQLMLVGDYISLFKYFESFNTLNWQLFWDKLSYKVTDYPKANIVIRLHTLSTESTEEEKNNDQ